MYRRIVAFTIAAIAVLGVTGCSSSSPSEAKPAESSSTAKTSDPPSTPDPTDNEGSSTSSDQSLIDECLAVQEQVSEASQKLASIDMSKAASDPQSVIDSMTETVDAIAAAADSASDPELKAATATLAEDFGGIRDALSKALIDKDTSALADMTKLTTKIQETTSTLAEACSR